MVKHLCLQIIQQQLCSSNCFSILQTAMQTGISSLLQPSLDLACSSFGAALDRNASGWAALSREGVLLVLQNSGLQVTSASECYVPLLSDMSTHSQICIVSGMHCSTS